MDIQYWVGSSIFGKIKNEYEKNYQIGKYGFLRLEEYGYFKKWK